MIDLDEIKARLAAATPGPWRVGPEMGAVVADGATGHDDAENVRAYGGHLVAESCKGGNRALIAHAPTDLTALLAEVARLRKRAQTGADGLRSAMADLHAMHHAHEDVCACSGCATVEDLIAGIVDNLDIAMDEFRAFRAALATKEPTP